MHCFKTFKNSKMLRRFSIIGTNEIKFAEKNECIKPYISKTF